jgi:hypothetical protein
MRKQRVVGLMLVAALVAGCAAHTPPAPADGRAPSADDEAGSIAANLLYAPGRGLLCGGERDNGWPCDGCNHGAVVRLSLGAHARWL